MRGKMFIILCLFFNSVVFGQIDIQYQNNTLKRVLQKNGIQDYTLVSEIFIADSLKQRYKLQGKFFIINSNINQYKYIYVGRVNSCRTGGCSISIEQFNHSNSEYFDYFIIYDQNKTVQLVRVFNYQATYGHEITSKGWLKQFIGYNSNQSLQVDKNIDAISGATISVYGITYDIEMKTDILINYF